MAEGEGTMIGLLRGSITRKPILAVTLVFITTTGLFGAGIWYLLGDRAKLAAANKGLVTAIGEWSKERERASEVEQDRQRALDVLAVNFAVNSQRLNNAISEIENECMDKPMPQLASVIRLLDSRAQAAGLMPAPTVDNPVDGEAGGSPGQRDTGNLLDLIDRARRILD